MTTIEKLGISGIRSYGTDKEAIIKFQRPLTIILGTNGSGKSSIIESVKMATTGEMPPMVSNGAAFINDPRISGRTETKAKIRLQFTNVRGEEYLVSRHFSLKMNRSGKSEFKTIDQTLKKSKRNRKKRRRPGEEETEGADRIDEDDEEGRSSSTSHRCADLNNLMPELMRVTKPILNSVIFVHQEDSLWPLSDAKALKVRFDDIFSATRYTKALEAIRKYRKEQASELRVVASELLRHEDRYKECEKLRTDAEDLAKNDRRLRKGASEIEEKKNALMSEVKKAKVCQTKYAEQTRTLETLDAQIKSKEESRKEKYDALTMDLTDMDDEALTALIKDLDAAIQRFSGEESDRKAGLLAMRETLKTLTEAYAASQKKLGIYQSEADRQKDRVKRLEKLKAQFSERFFSGEKSRAADVDGPPPHVDSKPEEWTAALKCLLDAARGRVREVTAERRAVENVHSDKVGEGQSVVVEKQANLDQLKNTMAEKKQARSAAHSALRQIKEGLSRTEVDEAEAAVETARVAAKAEADADKVGKGHVELGKLKGTLRELRDEVSEKKRTREKLSRDQNDRAIMGQKKKDYNDAQNDLCAASEDLLEKVKPICSELDIPAGNEGDDDDDDEVTEVGNHSGDAAALEEEKLRKEAMKLGDIILSFRERASAAADSDLFEAEKALGVVKEREKNAKAVEKEAEKKLALSENSLARLKGGLTDEMRDVVENSDGDANLIASTYSVIDGGRISMSQSNIDAARKVEDVAAETIRDADVQIADTGKGAEDPKMICELMSSCDYCYSCGHGSDPHFDKELAKSFCSGTEAEKKAQLKAIKLYAVGKGKKSWEAQMAYAEGILKDNSKDVIAGKVAVFEKGKKAALCLLKWAKEIQQVGDTYSDRADALDEAKVAAVAASEAFKDSREQTNVCKTAAAAAKKLSVGEKSDAVEIRTIRGNLRQKVKLRDTAFTAFERSVKALPADSASSMSLSEVEEEIRIQEKTLTRLHDSISDLRTEIESAKDALSHLNSKHEKAKNQWLVAKSSFEKKALLEKEKASLEVDLAVLENDVRAVKELMPIDLLKLQALKNEFEEIREESSTLVRTANLAVADAEKALSTWKDAVLSVESYIRSGKEAELARLERHIVASDAQRLKAEKDVQALEKDVDEANGKLKEKSIEYNNARLNESLRATQRMLELKQSAAADARHDIEQLVTECTAKAAELVAKESSRPHDENPQPSNHVKWGGMLNISRMMPGELVQELLAQTNDLHAQYSATMGQAQVFTERWSKKNDEFKQAEKLGSMKKYEECCVTKQTMELASSDLDRYHRALDQALMSFHALKMETINKSIRELWQTTYRGNDIDAIEIVSDGDGTSGNTSSAKRNYNYRVMMRRGDAKLDMRGRCSAGQKVLACLVIRLALAESFCTDCGILALDEPTTNLDADNVDSLAGALRAIIEARKRQAHFQLVIISHDQDFLTKLGARSFCDTYYSVHKGPTGFSSVKQHDIRQLEN